MDQSCLSPLMAVSIYGILHSPDYRTEFSSDLKKTLPRIPLIEEPRSFWKFSQAGLRAGSFTPCLFISPADWEKETDTNSPVLILINLKKQSWREPVKVYHCDSVLGRADSGKRISYFLLNAFFAFTAFGCVVRIRTERHLTGSSKKAESASVQKKGLTLPTHPQKSVASEQLIENE